MRDLTAIVIAIDGPAGAGKSTVSKRLAKELGLRYLDTGAMYRALALKAIRRGLTDEDGESASSLMDDTSIEFGHGDPQKVILDGEDVSSLIRTPEVGEMASALSQYTSVRRAMVTLQQGMVLEGGVVLEGRDATTVIAPNADLKIYLTASLEERALRRHKEYAEAGTGPAFDEVRNQIQHRDHRDITRDDSPLKVAQGAEVVDSANMTIEEVVDRIKALVTKA